MDSNSISSCGSIVSDNKIIKNNQLGFKVLFRNLKTELIFFMAKIQENKEIV